MLSHQKMFEGWIEAKKALIWEFSSSIDMELIRLFEEAREYAFREGLDFPQDLEIEYKILLNKEV